MRYLSIIAALLSILIFSCDRFDHDFTAPAMVDYDADFFAPLESALNSVTAADMSALQAMYSQDYIHNGINRSERLGWFQSFLSQDPGAIFEISETQSSTVNSDNADVNWRLIVLAADQSVLADSTFIGERIIRQGSSWLLYGNQVCVQPGDKQLVIAEYFTFRTCPSCPAAEAELNNLQDIYPQNFIYLEHHTMMELAVPGDVTNQYYQAYSAPSAVFQGMEKVTGGLPESVSQYRNIVDQLVLVDEPINYNISNLAYTADEVSTVVSLQPNIDLPTQNLVLHFVLITDEVEYTNADGGALHNVVRAKVSQPLTSADLGVDIPLNLSVPSGLPQSFKVVVFAQNKPATFQNQSTIYGGIVREISQSR